MWFFRFQTPKWRENLKTRKNRCQHQTTKSPTWLDSSWWGESSHALDGQIWSIWLFATARLGNLTVSGARSRDLIRWCTGFGFWLVWHRQIRIQNSGFVRAIWSVFAKKHRFWPVSRQIRKKRSPYSRHADLVMKIRKSDPPPNITPRYLRKIFLKRPAYRVCRPIMVFPYKNQEKQKNMCFRIENLYLKIRTTKCANQIHLKKLHI